MNCQAINYNVTQRDPYISSVKFKYYPIFLNEALKCFKNEISGVQKWPRPLSPLQSMPVVGSLTTMAGGNHLIDVNFSCYKMEKKSFYPR